MVFSDLACAGDVGNLIIALVPPPQKARLDLFAPKGGQAPLRASETGFGKERNGCINVKEERE